MVGCCLQWFAVVLGNEGIGRWVGWQEGPGEVCGGLRGVGAEWIGGKPLPTPPTHPGPLSQTYLKRLHRSLR
jgi:hypothetical protein